MIFLSREMKEQTVGWVRARILQLGTVQIRLFKNDWVEACDPLSGDFVEADFSGYATQVIGAGEWSSTTTYSAGAANINTINPVVWTHDGGAGSNDIYGYYVTKGAVLLYAQRNPSAPVLMQAFGPPYVVIPTFSIGQWDLSVCPV